MKYIRLSGDSNKWNFHREEMSERWTLADVLDYEVLLNETLESPSASGDLRDWYRKYRGKPSTGRILYCWLNDKPGAPSVVLPGKTVNRLYRVIVVLLAVFGFLAGSALGWGVLYYGGSNPVNLFLALSLLVIIPFLLTFFSFVLNILPQGKRRSGKTGERLMKVIRGTGAFFSHIGLVDKMHSEAVLNGISTFYRRSSIYNKLLRWFVSFPLQIRAFTFHLGIFTALLLRGIVQDVAFGWQTTLNVNSHDIYRLVYSISRPWRLWFPPPSVSQIEGSRIILKNGISGLDNSNLTVWWTFLWLAVLVYGVLPRLFLVLYTFIRRQIALFHLQFRDSKSRQLLLMMKTPGVEASGAESGRDKTVRSDPGFVPLPVESLMVFTVLIPFSRKDLLDKTSWETSFYRQWGASLDELIPVTLDDEEDAAILNSISKKKTGDSGLILVFEGWRPYTAAAGLYADYVRSLIPGDSFFSVALAGRPGKNFKMEEKDKETFSQWRRNLPGAVSSGACDFIEITEWNDG